MRTWGHSLAGLARRRNEDRYLIKELGQASVLLAVADGLSGQAAGDRAADTTTAALAEKARPSRRSASQLSDIIVATDRTMRRQADMDEALEGMGTTVTCVCFHDNVAYWAHVGDSRLYLFRNGEVIQITRDQTMAQFLVDEGEINAAQARRHDARHHLEQNVGCGTCEPDLGVLPIEPGDLFLLTTDGIHDTVADDNIRLLLNSAAPLESMARALIQAAREAEGTDDMTVVMAQLPR